MELTAQQVEKLTEGLDTAAKGLQEARTKMDTYNQQVSDLIKQQKTLEEGTTRNETGLKAIQQKMEELASKMVGLAEQHTNLLTTQRNILQGIGPGTEVADRTYRAPNGTIWESKRQAEEVGMYFMATMQRDCPAKTGARRWLQEHKSDLRYLPNIPKSFVQDMGTDWLKAQQEIIRGAYVQDLTGGATPGSVLVAPQFAQTLVRNVEQYGVFRQDAMIWPMGSDLVYIPRQRTDEATVYWEGEAEAGTEQDPSFDLLAMTAKKPMILHQFSSELNQDSAINLASVIMEFFSRSLAKEEDRIGFNGDGTGGNSPGYAGFVGVLVATRNGDTYPYGPIAVTGAAGNNLTTEITEAKLREMVGNLHNWVMQAKWYMHRTVLADISGIQMGTAGGSVVRFQDGMPASIMGYPVRLPEVMPVSPSSASTPVFALGDLRKSWILGDRLAPEIQTSEHYAFNTDQLTVRFKERISFLQVQGNGMVVYVTGTA